ncbi:peptidoglycan DD-metalloendopeptidase family protein [Pseudoalteromonas rubra]|uniref:Peptidoglycan DD-metalloendopeptidase family protein n=1 Tax=Pseudoalteromonas rubra TaxID=43658 RepID=A0A5S3UUE9_9GAMM|nr:M23 family metallopeptidase [Pseudoalteromonas rubra]QPB84457.1 peptidoglycan DD-metalloendopeptidase family protein [Pseudoalteromonas rubra]
MKTLQYALLAAGLAHISVHAQGQHHDETAFQISANPLTKHALTPLLNIDTQQFLFSNTLQQTDWESTLATHAPHLQDQLETLLHWAGHASINPKLLLALMEQHSQLLSAPTPEAFERPFGMLVTQSGFSAQLEALTHTLSQHFYAYEQWQGQQRNRVQHTVSDQVHSQALTVTPATFALSAVLDDAKALAQVAGRYQSYFGDALLNPAARLATPDVASATISNNFYLNFPWPSGYAWYSGGAHSNTGSGYPYSSLDFNNDSGGWGSNTPWVQAAHGGTVTRYSRCNIRITHPSGYATQYYHMDALQYQTGDVINAGAWLGRYANDYNTALCQGGQSSGPHLHFSLLYNGRFISLHNAYISGYRVDVGNYNYDDNCNRFYFERNGYRTCAWRALYR